tara:strand:- start:1392 stop:1544 length:153 start_codon:yes stop_codon:yes gene_type:complete
MNKFKNFAVRQYKQEAAGIKGTSPFKLRRIAQLEGKMSRYPNGWQTDFST